MKVHSIALAVILLFAVGAWAQAPPHQHGGAVLERTDTVIDGAKNPELIPDSTAFRSWLVMVSVLPTATDQDRDRQSAQLQNLNLGGLDSLQLIRLLADFTNQYQALIERYNESAKTMLAQGGQPDIKLFLQQRDDLVESTRSTIKLNLSPSGMSAIEIAVQAHKQFIRLHTQTSRTQQP